jgi:hypothetical protein
MGYKNFSIVHNLKLGWCKLNLVGWVATTSTCEYISGRLNKLSLKKNSFFFFWTYLKKNSTSYLLYLNWLKILCFHIQPIAQNPINCVLVTHVSTQQFIQYLKVAYNCNANKIHLYRLLLCISFRQQLYRMHAAMRKSLVTSEMMWVIFFIIFCKILFLDHTLEKLVVNNILFTLKSQKRPFFSWLKRDYSRHLLKPSNFILRWEKPWLQ